MDAHSEGTEAAAKLLAPALLGEDPRQLARIGQRMDDTIRGHGYAKAPFDAACWDLLGKATGQPVWLLLGGKYSDGAPMYRVAPQKSTDETLAEMARHVGATQAWGELLAWQLAQGADPVAELCLAKVQATKAFELCAREAAQVLGGASYLDGELVERLYREVRVQAIGGGSEEIMLDLAARQMRL